MTWEPCGLWAIKSGDWTISKALVAGEFRYTLWKGDWMRPGGLVAGGFKSADEAKALAERRKGAR